jgi:hypothetical protein
MSGSDVIGHNGNFSEQGIPDETNMPPSKQYALGWTDLNGNFWLFGGESTACKRQKIIQI